MVATASSTQDAAPLEGMMRSGIPVDRENQDSRSKLLPDAKTQVGKAGDRGIAARSLARFPPLPDTHHQNELLLTSPSPALMAEIEARRYVVEPRRGGLTPVILPPNGPPAWEVQRELEAKFPEQRLGLNYIYKPYHSATQPGGPLPPSPTPPIHTKGCSDERCYGPKLIEWDKGLATCAANLRVGMIDTSVDRTHPAFARRHLEIINLALKQDAPPALHWHGTGVLSLMAGAPESRTPGLIPDAKFSAVNVFFTNKNGELETDTAHLTEALAKLESEGVQVVNMSLVGPRDDLVHARIREMATRRGVVFVAAAGNGGPDAPAGYPAAYDEVIAVTAVDRKGGNYDHANRGAYIDAAAPGVQIWTALPGGKEGLLSGTSFAAPFVTAVAAVVYRDTGLEEAAREGRGPLNPKGVMLAHLFRKDELTSRSPVYGHGVIKAPTACGRKTWASVVTPTPPVPVSATTLARPPPTTVAGDSWQTMVQQGPVPSELAK